ncbi:MAG: HD-GYP domain-containing protein [Comamonadaceae bacterium]|nr:MAG: HD-GYP domain-containing protein [Comamonadaceae bacterium]
MTNTAFIDIRQVRIGMFIQLEVGWMNHPFPMSSFKISSQEQIETLQALGLQQIRYSPSKSDPAPAEPGNVGSGDGEHVKAASAASASSSGTVEARHGADCGGRLPPSRSLLQMQEAAAAQCDWRFTEATRVYQQIVHSVGDDANPSRASTDALVSGCVAELLANGDCAIRLLSEGVGMRPALHPVNVMVLSLLLGKALHIEGQELHEVGVAALLHDLGKSALPLHVAEPHSLLMPADRRRYESHVAESVVLARKMGWPGNVLLAIAQHHEMMDGSGFPQQLSGKDLGRAGQILALVNHYDRMCNPLHGADALTPHEALSVIFAQHKPKFDAVVLGAFIRMMGVYPPGSVVQLVNDRYALVISVNSSRPLRPRVLVHDPRVPADQALILDLESTPELGIRRSLRPSQMPREALDYLSPRKRICYFFERAVDPGPHEAQA